MTRYEVLKLSHGTDLKPLGTIKISSSFYSQNVYHITPSALGPTLNNCKHSPYGLVLIVIREIWINPRATPSDVSIIGPNAIGIYMCAINTPD